jgi:aminotransferase EvaB
MKVRYSYLPQKFAGCLEEGHPILENLRELLRSGDFTLGKRVAEFEEKFAKLIGAKHAVGVANGTDALRISLRAVGVKPGDEVITAANTFVASAGCIDELFAVPRFIDMAPNYVMDADLLEKAITPKTKAIIPVHFTGEPCEMDQIMEIANRYGIPVVEDACQAVLAEYKGRCVGNFGAAGAFSLHPLKNLNCWGDGGMIATNDTALYEKLLLMRNHGMVNRDEIAFFGCNSRLDALQAIVLNFLIEETKVTVAQRRANAEHYDSRLSSISQITLAPRRAHAKSCFHLYFFEVDASIRYELLQHLIAAGIEAKVHYPIPLQKALEVCGYWCKDFPKAYEQSARIITLPVDEHLTRQEQDYVVDKIIEYFS